MTSKEISAEEMNTRAKALSERLASFIHADAEKEPSVLFAASVCLAASMTSLFRVPAEVAQKTFMTFRNGADEVLLNIGARK
jgi:hypothetical protein